MENEFQDYKSRDNELLMALKNVEKTTREADRISSVIFWIAISLVIFLAIVAVGYSGE